MSRRSPDGASVKHSVPATVITSGCFSMAACIHCLKFGTKDGDEGCEGRAAVDDLKHHRPPQPMFIVGTVTRVFAKGMEQAMSILMLLERCRQRLDTAKQDQGLYARHYVEDVGAALRELRKAWFEHPVPSPDEEHSRCMEVIEELVGFDDASQTK